jgi:glycosyltransferase involved in cell wall biosynthesis
MKIYFLSVSTFSDNQFDLLRELAADAEITYGVIFPHVRPNFTPDEVANALAGSGVNVIPFRQQHRFRDPRVIKTYLEIVRSIKRIDPDIIYFTNFDQLYINLLMLMVDKRKTIIAFHDVQNHSNTRFDYLTNIGKKILLTRFQVFHTFSKLQEEILLRAYPSKTVFTIPLVLISFGKKPAAQPPKKETVFLFFGNILYYKGLDLLLKAVNRVARITTNFKLVIAGRSDEWAELYEPLIEDNSVVEKMVRFITIEEIPVLFGTADYLVLPYRDTTQSGPLMIAYNYNLPVITSNAEGFHEFVKPGITGYMFDLDKADDLDRVLLEAINRPGAELQQLIESQQQFVKANFSIRHLAGRYRAMFEQVSGNS